MSVTFTTERTFRVLVCPTCAMDFGIPIRLDEILRETKNDFYCPSGHSQSFREGEVDRLKKQVVALTATKDRLEMACREKSTEIERRVRQLSAARGLITRTKRRVANGVCPCCKRSFEDLHRHMTTKHPNYESESLP